MRWRFPKYKVLSVEATIDLIIEKKISITRFGDGEFDLMLKKKDIGFQKLDFNLSKELLNVLNNKNPNLLVCIPESLSSIKKHKKFAREFWIAFINNNGKVLAELLDLNYEFGNANISRLYIFMKNKAKSKYHFDNIKKIWHDKDVLIIEGNLSRLGIGNDLFSNVRSLKRIVCPSENAFEKYATILKAATKYGDNKLILIALGPTATVLSSDLCDKGYWAIDIGHIDIEYMWMLMGVNEKIAIKGKHVNESQNDLGYEMDKDDLNNYKMTIILNLSD